MNTFTNTIKNNVSTSTTNGMRARTTSNNLVMDLFYKIAASRGKDLSKDFLLAYNQNRDLTLRLLQWVRDIRGGAGERQMFRDLLKVLDDKNVYDTGLILRKIPDIGRWDDMLVVSKTLPYAFQLIKDELSNVICEEKSSLVAKWLPRKGEMASKLRKYFALSAKDYRKMLVAYTNVVEQKMCSKQWDTINFNHVPSKASQLYKKAFAKNSTTYQDYLLGLKTGVSKVNANAIFPHDVLKDFSHGDYTNIELITSQWDSLPDYLNGKNILAMSDVSGSMSCPVGGLKNSSCMAISIALGLYIADKSKGAFKDVLMTFDTTPMLYKIKGTIAEKYNTISQASWGGSTNFEGALQLILDHAVKNKVVKGDMPEYLLVLSDMQFDEASNENHSALQMIKKNYKEKGYDVPKIIFWNLNDHSNVPVKFNKEGTAMVSGFSPSILKSVLSADLNEKDFTPENIMLKTLMDTRYDFE